MNIMNDKKNYNSSEYMLNKMYPQGTKGCIFSLFLVRLQENSILETPKLIDTHDNLLLYYWW